jgi:hypothetical protein
MAYIARGSESLSRYQNFLNEIMRMTKNRSHRAVELARTRRHVEAKVGARASSRSVHTRGAFHVARYAGGDGFRGKECYVDL